MENKKIFLLGGIISILLIFVSIIYIAIPKVKIEIIGDKEITLNVYEDYVEKGATAHLKSLFENKELEITIKGEVGEYIGKYTITYETEYEGEIKKEYRTVYVKDIEEPIITLNKEVVGCKNNNLIEIDAKIIDNIDGDITDKLKYKITKDKVEIYASDSSDNVATIETKIKYIDEEAPDLTLNGSSEIILNVDEEYIEEGATAYDSCDGDITENIEISGKIDNKTPGVYEITYKIEDSAKKIVKKKRKITVTEIKEEKEHTGTIYLTFDDGPGKYTEDFLKVLDEYDVKATFFVTGQFPKYEYLIKEEYEKGHAVGVHTYSHRWSIYKSVETYQEDFNKINEIIYKQTGVYSKIFRFPGGSSNTVSRNQSVGIMSKLSKIMEANGYTYFDWTFDSGDTHKTNNSKKDIINNVKKYLKGKGDYIILMHDLKQSTLEALPEIIEYGREKGYVFKKIDDTTLPVHFKIAN